VNPEEMGSKKGSKAEGRKKMKEEFDRGKMKFNDPTEERNAFRARILSVSLFPNVFNQETIMTSLGPS
jgi:hypothetical protein